jgi:F-type H+-transporting ATPase subunit b
MKKISLSLLLLCCSSLALAADGGHGESIPFDKIGWQAVNLGILVAGIIVFIRKSIVEAFAGRRESFLSQAEKTKAALKDAELALAEIKSKLSSLESGEARALENANKEAAHARESFIKDALISAEKAKRDAEMSLANEVLKAKEEINALIVNQAILKTKQKISTNSTDRNTSENEVQFIKQLEQVRP